jgi:hypothetical protein
MATKCSAIAKSGSRCTTPVVAGSTFCWMHDPGSAELRREAARKGGRNRSAKARAAAKIPDALPPDQLAGLLSLLFTQVMSGRTEPRIGTACATIARTMLEIRQQTELEVRIEELEAMAGLGRRVG